MTRFTSVAGDVFDASRPPNDRRITIGEAYSMIGIWSRNALEFDDLGARRVASIFARDCRDLCIATAIAEDWLAAGGNEDARLARLARQPQQKEYQHGIR